MFAHTFLVVRRQSWYVKVMAIESGNLPSNHRYLRRGDVRFWGKAHNDWLGGR